MSRGPGVVQRAVLRLSIGGLSLAGLLSGCSSTPSQGASSSTTSPATTAASTTSSVPASSTTTSLVALNSGQMIVRPTSGPVGTTVFIEGRDCTNSGETAVNLGFESNSIKTGLPQATEDASGYFTL